ncbi:NB-ARC domain-containing protein [Streptomyces sp. NPDC051940]|uniref:ATP-binding protein n=1 Tax=Streptomyces sp. NPDC051940 TaxID=3155675 RepID=UPI003418856F
MRRTPLPRSVPVRRPSPGNLPAELNRFVGRAKELAELERLLSSAPLVTVTGVGGVGKTRIALRVAARLQDRFSGGVWVVDLSALRDGGLLEHTVLDALGLTDGPGVSPASRLAEHLADREVLLVLDGCEHLTADCGRLTDALLGRAPGLTVLATSRRALGTGAERPFRLQPLPACETDSDAAALFADRAGAVLPGFDAGGADREAVAELCRRLDGIPLALELAAGRLRALSVVQILQRLDDRFRLLAGSSRSALPRHQTLRTAIGWSHELCTPQERLLWARLSVFAGDFDLDAAEYLCAGDGLAADDVHGVIEELVAQSVVIREQGGDRVRYRMLETMREYGARWLEGLEATEALRLRHRDWYLGLATWCEMDWFGPRQQEVASRVEAELPNLRLALEYCLEVPEDAHVGQYLAATLWFYWTGCGRISEGRRWLERALELESTQLEPRAKALWVAGYLAVLCGEPVAALTALHEGRRLAENIGDDKAAAHAVQMLGLTAALSDDMPRAVELLGQSVERFRALGESDSLVLLATVQLGMASGFAGDLDTAVALHESVRDTARESGERWALGHALCALGHARWQRGEPGPARELVLEGLAVHESFHDVLGMTHALELMAALVADEDPALTARLQGGAAAAWRTFGRERFGSWHFATARRHGERRAREALGDCRYETELRVGRELGLAAVVGELLAQPGATRRRPRTPCCEQREPGPCPGRGGTHGPPAPRKPDQRA